MGSCNVGAWSKCGIDFVAVTFREPMVLGIGTAFL